MKIAITAQGDALSSAVDPRFGRAKYFIIADTETDEFAAVDNAQNLNAAQGAGVQSAGNVAGHGVAAVLTGHCGPKAFKALSAAGIKVYQGVEGTVSEALEKFKSGGLTESENANVEGRWV